MLLPRLPRRHALVAASAASGGAAADPAVASAASSGGLPRPKRVCIMVEPSPFTYVCGYMNRYRNTIRFLTEARGAGGSRGSDSCPAWSGPPGGARAKASSTQAAPLTACSARPTPPSRRVWRSWW